MYTALGRLWLEHASLTDRVAIDKALEALEPAASRPTATSETLALYGRALLLSGNTEAAVRTLQQATARAPVEPLAYRYLSEAATQVRDSSIARDADIRYAALTEP